VAECQNLNSGNLVRISCWRFLRLGEEKGAANNGPSDKRSELSIVLALLPETSHGRRQPGCALFDLCLCNIQLERRVKFWLEKGEEEVCTSHQPIGNDGCMSPKPSTHLGDKFQERR
jgi:hypothetical protein